MQFEKFAGWKIRDEKKYGANSYRIEKIARLDIPNENNWWSENLSVRKTRDEKHLEKKKIMGRKIRDEEILREKIRGKQNSTKEKFAT